MFSWTSFSRPIIALAPMSGYTDSPYRQLVKELCPFVVCFTEFTNIEGLLRQNKGSLRQVLFDSKKERPIIAQIFGKQPQRFKEAAKILTDMGVDAIDINMGCPARKVVKSDHGSSLLKNQPLAEEIVAAAAAATPLPVSVKMRIGINTYDEDKFLSFVKGMERAGAKLLTIHGRTAKQMYSGTADWAPIYKAKKILKIPVIGNGDIRCGADAVSKLQNLDGIMVGRGAFGNPWVFLDVHAALHNKNFTSLSFEKKLPTIERHILLACKSSGSITKGHRGVNPGVLEMRKHLVWYVRGIPGASDLRQKLMRLETAEEIISLLRSTAGLSRQESSQA